MIEANIGQLGATGDSWRPKSVRNLLSGLLDKYPDASEPELVDHCIELIQRDRDYAESVAQYVVRNALEAIMRGKRVRDRVALKKEAASIAKKILLLNLEMPNGKRMKDCKGTELVQFGGKYVTLGKKAGRKFIGKAFTETEIRKIIHG